MPTVMDDLKTAFAGESQANRKYTAYARKAEADGFPTVACLFRAAAEAETIHALGHFNAMGAVGSTADNLKDAVGGETYEYTQMYPPMLERALAEAHKAKLMFGYALKAEEVHANLYQAALDAVNAGRDLAKQEVYLCPVCGHIEIGKPPARCPICNTAGEKYRRIE